MDDEIGIGVIGISFGQYVHVPAFRSVPECEVRAICATTQQRAQDAADRLGIEKAYEDPKDLIADPKIDVVSIAVPPYLQPPLVEAAARAGKHVFCEKPLGNSLLECQAAIEAARNAKIRHAVNFIFPESAMWHAARQILQERRLGNLRQAVVSWRVETRAYKEKTDNWRTSPVQGGGTLLNLVSHSAYYIEWLFGRINSLCAHLRGEPVDAGVEAWLRIGSLEVTMSVSGDNFAGTGHRIEIYGNNGTLVLKNESADYVNGFELEAVSRDAGAVRTTPNASSIDGRIDATSSIVQRFIRGVVNNTPVTPNLEDGLRVQHLLDAMRRSHESGRWIDV